MNYTKVVRQQTRLLVEVACATTEESDEDYGMADMGDTVWRMRSCVSAIEFDSISSGQLDWTKFLLGCK